MDLKGKQVAAFQEALLSAFPEYDDLEQMLRFDLDVRLPLITSRDAMRTVTFRLVKWAEAEGKGDKISDATREAAKSAGLSDHEIEGLIAERNQARKTRNFKRADEIRQQLLDAGIILEDTKDGVRWKRK